MPDTDFRLFESRGDARAGMRFELLGAAASDLLNARGPSNLVSAVVETVAAVAGTPHAYLCLADPDTGVLSVRSGTGVFAGLVGFACPEGGSLSGGLDIRGPRALPAKSAGSVPCREIAELGVHALLETQLVMRGLTGGVLGAGLTETGRTFGPSQVELVTQLGQLAALKLENDHLNEVAHGEMRERQRVEEELRDLIAWLRRSEDELRRSRAETIARLAHAAEFRNLETAVHVERMSRYCATLAARIGFSEDRVELIRVASTLHDIGKIAIPDSVLLKPASLTNEERRVMMRHAEMGSELLSGSASEVLEMAALIASTHHERFDGSGYPHGLAGEEIPVEGRIAAVADVFDALISDRVYRPALPLSDALTIMRDERGRHFDPEILDLFLDSIRELEAPVSKSSPPFDVLADPPIWGRIERKRYFVHAHSRADTNRRDPRGRRSRTAAPGQRRGGSGRGTAPRSICRGPPRPRRSGRQQGSDRPRRGSTRPWLGGQADRERLSPRASTPVGHLTAGLFRCRPRRIPNRSGSDGPGSAHRADTVHRERRDRR